MSKKTKTQTPTEEPSDLFARSFCGGGTTVIDCGFCGRVNYDSSGEFMEKGEIEDLENKAKSKPEKYFGREGQVLYGYLAGRIFIPDCPCHEGRKYEEFIWQYRYQIASYLSQRTANELEQATRQSESIGVLGKIK